MISKKESKMIHPTAVIYDGAKVASSAEIGPYCVIGSNVEIKDGVILKSHVCVDGYTVIDEGTTVFPFASLGLVPQDLKYSGEKSTVYIGKNNTIREYVTIHPGTEQGGMKTEIGDNCLLMIGVHVAHDCKIGNNVIMANNVTLAGHVNVADFAIIGGMSAVHQFVRIGAHSIIGGGSIVVEDVIPFGNVVGERAGLAGLNIVGMKRRNFDRETIKQLQIAFKRLFVDNDNTFESRVNDVEENFGNNEKVKEIVQFLKADSSRSICMPKIRDES
ncbi:acyl-CoA dehydrogenase [endosymbiont of Acanthamoeba sp. UWC8]|nr:acyl-CoA dehydrogenase [endosymbiont of Acanthamoeba sp. UWC8]